MFGGATPTRHAVPTSLPEDVAGKSHRDKQLLEFNERQRIDEEEIIFVLAQIITTNNSN